MFINDLLEKKNITRYKLSKLTGIPQTTIHDICSGKSNIENCSVGIVLKIANVLDVTVEELCRRQRPREPWTVKRGGHVYHLLAPRCEEEAIEVLKELSALQEENRKKDFLAKAKEMQYE